MSKSRDIDDIEQACFCVILSDLLRNCKICCTQFVAELRFLSARRNYPTGQASLDKCTTHAVKINILQLVTWTIVLHTCLIILYHLMKIAPLWSFTLIKKSQYKYFYDFLPHRLWGCLGEVIKIINYIWKLYWNLSNLLIKKAKNNYELW